MDVVGCLARFGAVLEASGFGVLLREGVDVEPVLNVWNPCLPGVGVSVVAVLGEEGGPWLRAAGLRDLGTCGDLALAARELAAVFVEWGLSVPVVAS